MYHFAAVGGRVFLLPMVDLLHDDIETAMAFDGLLPPESASFAGQAGISRGLAYQNTPERLLHRFSSQGTQVPPPAPPSCGAPEGRARRGQRCRCRNAKCRGANGKTAVVAVKDRPSNRVQAEVVSDTKATTLQGFVLDRVRPGATVFTDEARAYDALPNRKAVAHSLLEYVRGPIHTNGVESFWSMLKRAHMGTFHRLSPCYLHRYVSEFAGRHNMRGLDTLSQMVTVVRLMDGHRLRYRDLIG